MPYMLAVAGQGPVPETSTPGVWERGRSASLHGDLWEAMSVWPGVSTGSLMEQPLLHKRLLTTKTIISRNKFFKGDTDQMRTAILLKDNAI